MNYTTDILDSGMLTEGFTLGALVFLHQHLTRLSETIRNLKDDAMLHLRVSDIVKHETEEWYVESNIQIVEAVIAGKELEVFLPIQDSEICLN